MTVTLPAAAPNPADVVRVSGVGAGGWKIAQNASQSVLAKNVPGNIGNLWVPRDNDRNWTSVASSLDGSKLVATAPSDQIYTSTDSGMTWAPHTTGLAWNAVGPRRTGANWSRPLRAA